MGLSTADLREQVPLAASVLTARVRIDGQRFVDPGEFVRALGRAVVRRSTDGGRSFLRVTLPLSNGLTGSREVVT